MVSLTGNGKILYRASKPGCIPFPKQGDPELDIGIPRNYEIFDPLDFLAQVTQHIPNKGEHQIRYYGWYSNKRRGMRGDNKSVTPSAGAYGPDEYWEKLEANTALSFPFLKRKESGTSYLFCYTMQDDLGGSYQVYL